MMSSPSSRSRKGNNPRPRKKAKVEEGKQEEEEQSRLWTALEEIPAAPAGFTMVNGVHVQKKSHSDEEDRLNRHKRDIFVSQLSESLLAAVTTGNAVFVRQVIETQRTRDFLVFTNHKPQKNYRDATAELLRLTNVQPPVQPNFGIQALLWKSTPRWSVKSESLVVQAAQSNQLEVLKELVRLGFDMNVSHIRGTNSRIDPLLIAIENRHSDIVQFLLNQPQIIVTHPMTRQYRRGNGRSRPRSEPTALSEAAKQGLLDVVKQLIKKGALDAASTSRPDDTYSLAETNRDEATELVSFSIKEAIYNAHELACPPKQHYVYPARVTTPEVYAGILETILSEMGTQDDNAITVDILDKICRDAWEDIASHSYYSYYYRLDEDSDFDRETWQPSARARAIARGLRPWMMNPDCLHGVPGLSDSIMARQKEKHEQWMELVKICQDRLSNASSDWKEAPEKAFEQENNHEVDNLNRRRQLLLWCQLFVTPPIDMVNEPWSPERHHCYPIHVRLYVRELLCIGSQLERSKTGYKEGGIKEIWDREIVPFVIA